MAEKGRGTYRVREQKGQNAGKPQKEQGARRQQKEQDAGRLLKEQGARRPQKEQSAQEQRKQSKSARSCPIAQKCGGCQYIEMPYDQQLKEKQKTVGQLLQEYGKVNKIIGMENPDHYRNKVHAVFDYQKGKGIISGIYQEKTHLVVPVEECLLEDKRADAIIRSVRELAKSFKFKIYDEDTGYGLLRHVMVRVGCSTGQIMVVLVLSSPILPSRKNFVDALCKLHPEISTIVLNINHKNTSMVLGEKEQILYGKGYIEDRLCGKMFRISSKSFYQVNAVQTQKLYEKAIEYAALTGKETVIDAYCGIGTIGLAAAEYAGKVIGVELNQAAVRDAVVNAKINAVKNIDFYQNDAGKFMTQLADAGEKVDVVFMDPPRSGSTETFMDAMLCLGPDRIVYISCNPETLARDLAYLTGQAVKKGAGGKRGKENTVQYRVVEMTPVDMFPYTVHTETCVLLSRKKSSGKSTKIEIEIDLNEADRRECIGKATYQEIKDYIWEHYQTKVSHLYIAQIKKKCGLDVGENFNKPKTEGNKVRNCPPEKERMIREALEYFGMINKE